MAQQGNPFYVEPMAAAGAAQGLGSLFAGLEKRQQQQQAEQAQQEIEAAVASGDVGQVQTAMAKYPQMGQAIEQAYQFSSEQTRQDMADTAFDVLRDISAGGTGMGPVEGRISRLQALGLPADETASARELNPEQLREAALLTLAQIDPQRLQAVQGLMARPGTGKTTAKLAEFDRWAGMAPGPDKDALGQLLGITKRGKNTNIPTPTGYTTVNEAGEVVTTVEIPAKKKQFEAQQKEREQALAAKERAEKEKIRQAEIAEMDYQDSLKQTTDQSIKAFKVASDLLKPGFIDAATGTWDRWTPTLFKNTQDAINKGLELKNMLTLENLGLMSGVLTDRDIEVLSSAGSGLRVDEDGFIGSEKAVRQQIEDIQDQLEMRLRRAVTRGTLSQEDFDAIVDPEGRVEVVTDEAGMPVGGATGQPQLSPFSPAGQAQQQQFREGQTATNPQTGEKMIFRGGQWVSMGG